MEHVHIRNDEIVVCDSCPQQTHYPSAPSMADQALFVYRRKMELLRDMNGANFVSYVDMRRQARDVQRQRGEEFDKAG